MEILIDGGLIKLRSAVENNVYNIYSGPAYNEEVFTAFELRQQIKKLLEAANKAEQNLKGIKC